MSKPLLTMRVEPYPWTLKLFNDQSALERHSDIHLKGCEFDPIQTGNGETMGVCRLSRSYKQILLGVFNGESSTLVHELTHAVMVVFDDMGVEMRMANTEPFAYTMQWLYDRCIAALLDHYRRKRHAKKVKKPSRRRTSKSKVKKGKRA